MGALLERHGIGNGKYKVGGSYPNSILLDDSSMGRGQILLQYTETEGSKILQSVEFGENGTFYVGSRSGTNNLFKLDSDGSVLWETNVVTSPTYIVYDKFDDMLWVYDSAGNQIVALDQGGNVLITIPYNVTTFTGMQVTEEYLIVSNFGSTTVTTVNSISFYNKGGSLVRNLTNQGVRTIEVIDNFLYVVDVNRLRKYNLSASQSWEYTISNNTIVGNKAYVVKLNGVLVLYTFISGSPGTALVTLINDTSGALIRSQTRSALNINPETTDDYPLTNSLFIMNKDQTNVLLVSTETGSGVTLKYLNESLKITSRRLVTITNTAFNNRFKLVSINDDSNIVLVSNKNMYFIDPKEYYRIIK